jgi:ATP-binding cassette, subfamily C (CFTR/MRP), member 1
LCIGQVVLISVAARYFAAAVPFSLVVVYLIQRCYLRTSRQLRFLDLEAKSPLYSLFTDCISGLATIRAFGWQRQLKKHNIDLLDASQKPFYMMWTIQRWLTVVLDLFIAGIAVILIVMVVTLRGKISGGYVGIALLNVILFNQCVKLFINFWTMMETHIGAVSRIRGFVSEVRSEDSAYARQDPPDYWPNAGRITLKGVSAAYRYASEWIK